jgi:Kef-type K+ transport system membrane component KefB
MSDVDLGVRFFLQLVVILMACRVIGYLGRYIGQTQVVGEMIAGVMLGPSLLGLFSPATQEYLFPKWATIADQQVSHPSMQILYVASQLGLVLYMFIVGLEFDVRLISESRKGALLVSVAGIAAPILMGGIAGYWLHANADCFIPEVPALSAAFFVGASMAITAFPMLARIIYENGIARTRMGTLALGAAAANDAVAWCLLAIVLATVHSDMGYVRNAIGGGVALCLLLVSIQKPILSRFEFWFEREGKLSHALLIVTFLYLMLCAYATDVIGIYAIFGAFLAGAMLPSGKYGEALCKTMEPLVTTLLLPLFFVYSGLNTKIGLINSPTLWLITIGLIVIATVSKGGACLLAARASGESWRDSTKIGVLMNARGLIELIILNIGLQQKVITPTLFTMMVIVAIVTTLMASPLFQWLHGKPTSVLSDSLELA